ncbi:MAG: hypothetical protein WC314_12755 [Vulcanimicrobiota bacterium]
MTTSSWRKPLSAFAILFGLVTIKQGGSVLFLEAARLAAGNIVPFVLWFNFIAGFFYVTAGVGIWSRRTWAAPLAAAIAALTVLVFLAFGLHIFTDGLYETRTVAAMTLRSCVWLGLAFFSRADSQNRGGLG